MIITVERSVGPQARMKPVRKTWGKWSLPDGTPLVVSVEPEVRHEPRASAIPAGRYRCVRKLLMTYGPTLVLLDVPGHEEERIARAGLSDPAGSAIVVGTEFDAQSGVRLGTSEEAIRRITALLDACESSGDELWIEFVDPGDTA